MIQLAVSSSEPGLLDSARKLAAELGLRFVTGPASGEATALLRLCPDGLELLPTGPGAPGPIRVDFGSGGMRHRRHAGHNEPLGRAAGVGKWHDLRVLDATAGLGRDAFVLADLGCRVTLLERSPAVYALLRDGLDRARESGDPWLAGVCSRMDLQFVDSAEWLRGDGPEVDVVYLDPMFPPRRKSARVKKEMWLFQVLLEEVAEDPELLSLALSRARRRVVVKRPLKAPPLAGVSPHHALSGKAIRFDVYSCGSA